MSDYNCVVVLGPTAVGKTAIAVRIAYEMDGEIISADSRQTYRHLDIGSGKDLDEYNVNGKAIPYHLIDICELPDEYNVFNYQNDFFTAWNDITARKKLPVIAGGTGLYLDSIIRKYQLLPVKENKALREELAPKSCEELTEILLKLCPEYHSKNDFYEKDRLIKAIEIETAKTGEEGERLRAEIAGRPEIKPFIIGTTLPRPQLWENISVRLKERLDQGMIEEVKAIHDSGISFERLEKLGLEYRYCSLFLEGKITSKEDLYNQLFVAIRQFAKRQETWFRMMEKKGVKINWLEPADKESRIKQALDMVKLKL
jgi:tRNA dimethylallyltransferase